ncbi:hypothetical protein C8A03DRAFT_37844 [Achaetomium macrosporum]|uniref:Uncharacterized protein n=1 Tax=Achaetomium macrosporum TaxID=79813 RepID=A0AAN7H4E9_9PEZI|nr:hypothetical protein C8A03DRAFT_37844 [Achaetomium macrosporum]
MAKARWPGKASKTSKSAADADASSPSVAHLQTPFTRKIKKPARHSADDPPPLVGDASDVDDGAGDLESETPAVAHRPMRVTVKVPQYFDAAKLNFDLIQEWHEQKLALDQDPRGAGEAKLALTQFKKLGKSFHYDFRSLEFVDDPPHVEQTAEYQREQKGYLEIKDKYPLKGYSLGYGISTSSSFVSNVYKTRPQRAQADTKDGQPETEHLGSVLKFPVWNSVPHAVGRLDGKARLIFEHLAYERTEPARWCLRNGDVGKTGSSKVNMVYTTLVAGLNVLRFSTVSPTSEECRFRQDRSRDGQEGWYLGFHADDWVRAVFAIYFFYERRRHHVVDVRNGGFAPPKDGYVLYRPALLDSTRIVDKSLVDLSKAAAITHRALQMRLARAQCPTLPPGIDDNRLDALLRRGESRFEYLAGLRMHTSLTRARTAMIQQKAELARQIGERYAEMYPLSLPQGRLVQAELDRRFGQGASHVVEPDIVQALRRWHR